MTIYCSKCGNYVTCFHQTQKGKRYCWRCWNEIIDWLKKTKNIGNCIFCERSDIVFEDEVWIQGKKLQLCKECYGEIYEVKNECISQI